MSVLKKSLLGWHSQSIKRIKMSLIINSSESS
jgi:hypothetical protein